MPGKGGILKSDARIRREGQSKPPRRVMGEAIVEFALKCLILKI